MDTLSSQKLIVRCPSGRLVWLIDSDNWVWPDSMPTLAQATIDVHWLEEEGWLEYVKEYYKFVV